MIGIIVWNGDKWMNATALKKVTDMKELTSTHVLAKLPDIPILFEHVVYPTPRI